MLYVVGILATISMWLVYLGFVHQWLKVWRNNVAPTLPNLLIINAILSYVSYSVWGFAKPQTDYVQILGYFPGLIAVSVLALQFDTPRPSTRMIVERLIFVSLVSIAGWVWIQLFLPQIKMRLHFFATVGTLSSIFYILCTMPAQIIKVRREGRQGSSLVFCLAILFSFIVWLLYGILTSDPFLIASQSLGTVLQSAVVYFNLSPHTREARG